MSARPKTVEKLDIVHKKVVYVEDELGVILYNLGKTELKKVKEACEALMDLTADDRNEFYESLSGGGDIEGQC
jgi:hypothetical protein